MAQQCTHLAQVRAVTPKAPDGCEECLASGDEWVHLRLCLECGHVGCCDDSPNRHATKHFHKTKHPIMRSFEPGEDWGFCYVDDRHRRPRPWIGARDGPRLRRLRMSLHPRPGAGDPAAPDPTRRDVPLRV